MSDGTTKGKGIRHALKMRWYALWIIGPALVLYPINSLSTRIATLVIFAVLLIGLIFFNWKRPAIRSITIAVIIIIGVFFLLPGRKPDKSKLRRSYVAALSKYEGTKYIWGGENRLGIDCSGLVRSGLIVANYEQGFTTLNSGLVRNGLSMWWYDCSARALGEEYQHVTKFLFSSPSINEINSSKILPGDIAVTEDGIHTLAYLGDQTWIEADPDQKRVIKVHIPSDSPWFKTEVRIMRWTELDQPNPGS